VVGRSLATNLARKVGGRQGKKHKRKRYEKEKRQKGKRDREEERMER
jgi:hypothetical protein